jgi:hypothetical protein
MPYPNPHRKELWIATGLFTLAIVAWHLVRWLLGLER